MNSCYTAFERVKYIYFLNNLILNSFYSSSSVRSNLCHNLSPEGRMWKTSKWTSIPRQIWKDMLVSGWDCLEGEIISTLFHDTQFAFMDILKLRFCLRGFFFEGSVGEHRQRSNQETYTVETTNGLLISRQFALPCQVHIHELFRLLWDSSCCVVIIRFELFCCDSISMLLILNNHTIRSMYQNFSLLKNRSSACLCF